MFSSSEKSQCRNVDHLYWYHTRRNINRINTHIYFNVLFPFSSYKTLEFSQRSELSSTQIQSEPVLKIACRWRQSWKLNTGSNKAAAATPWNNRQTASLLSHRDARSRARALYLYTRQMIPFLLCWKLPLWTNIFILFHFFLEEEEEEVGDALTANSLLLRSCRARAPLW